jgi:pimeloyl-ACP methyl ester carboxylesterase
VAYGDRDIPLANEETQTLAERLPNVVKVHVFQDAAHLPGLERPEEVAALIDEAINRR